MQGSKLMHDIETEQRFVLSKFKEDQGPLEEMSVALKKVSGLPGVLREQFAVLKSYSSGKKYSVILREFAHHNLKEKINSQLKAEAKVKYARYLLNGLFEMHEQGVVHRNITPTKIFILEGRGYFSVLDSATAVFPNKACETEYMPPEFTHNQSYDITALKAGDVYQLGITLYELFNEEYLGNTFTIHIFPG